MPKWTKEQEEAIKSNGENIIVSAGAGSGKTAVLSARVIDKLKSGVNIEELLIMTFTSAAALEMKNRIREELKSIPELKSQLSNLDQAYITTFDSFSLSILKKYHYVLGIDRGINIGDSSLLMMKKDEIMDQVFLSFYESKNELFLKMIGENSVKDDESIRKLIISIASKLELKWDIYDFLDSYISKYYKEDNFLKFLSEYKGLIDNAKNEIKACEEKLYLVMGSDYADKVSELIKHIYDDLSSLELKSALSFRLPNLPRDTIEDGKICKEELSSAIKALKDLLIFGDEDDIRNSFYKTQDNASVVIDIIREYFVRLDEYKRENKVYDFIDIAKMSIKIVKENPDICDEIRNSFKEILLDEYQDTNDLQEEFVSLISNNNVYMVGDVKQSIYRFRNANPNIFRDKYNDYSSGNGGKKIDLLSNFRSRSEVLDDINKIFRQVMDEALGGASYVVSHQMVFGNMAYEESGKTQENSYSEFWQYNREKDSLFTNEEIEAFLVARDIKEKISQGYMVYDKKNSIRKVCYSDFLILMDRASNFNLYKRIFTYSGIPVTLYKDENLENSDETYLISNIIDFVISIKRRDYNGDFKRDFVSIARSFLYSMSDDEIYSYVKNSNIWDSMVYKDFSELAYRLDVFDVYHVISEIIRITNFYEKSISVGDQEEGEVKLGKILVLASNLGGLGYDIYQFNDYLKKLLENGYSIKYSVNKESADSVKVMTIHKSKGLDGTICYFTGLYKKFNIRDVIEKFLFSDKYGLVVPYFDEGIAETFLKTLVKEDYIVDEISEKIRLFYVALTRAREKMIFVLPNSEINDNGERLIDYSVRKKFRSLADIINSLGGSILKSFKVIDYESQVSKDYLYQSSNSKLNLSSSEIINVLELPPVKESVMESKHFSKTVSKLNTKEEIKNMEFGTKIHECLEYIDFKNPRLDLIEDEFVRNKVSKFLSNKMLENVREAQVYKEYEFMYEEDGNTFHGIIDCMIVYDSYVDIIDYKLKNVEDEAYVIQLDGYKRYIEKLTGKRVNTYLYSILDSEIREVDYKDIMV